MKKLKLIIGGTLFLTCVSITALKVNPTFGSGTIEELYLTNTEALAQGEGLEGGCAGSGDMLCGSRSTRVRID